MDNGTASHESKLILFGELVKAVKTERIGMPVPASYFARQGGTAPRLVWQWTYHDGGMAGWLEISLPMSDNYMLSLRYGKGRWTSLGGEVAESVFGAHAVSDAQFAETLTKAKGVVAKGVDYIRTLVMPPVAPCPVCGGPARIAEIADTGKGYVHCRSIDCGVSGPVRYTQEAAQLWNKLFLSTGE